MYPELRTIQDPAFSRGQTQTFGFDENDDDSSDNVDDYDYQARARQYLTGSTRNIEINLEEARLAKRDVFTLVDIAVRHFRS